MPNKLSRPQNNPIFIVGAQRSGTTLLRLILNTHSQIAIPEEARFLIPLLNKKYLNNGITGASLRSLVDYLSANEQFKLWNYDSQKFLAALSGRDEISLSELITTMYSSYCRSEGKPLWGDKSLFFRSIDVLHALFPDARFIHIVRDGRDVFDSWRKMDTTKSNPAVVALDWNYKQFRIERSLRIIPPKNVLTIRYEDLIENPEKITQSVCAFAGLEYEPSMLSFHETSHRYIGEHHSKLIFNAIDKSNHSKWRKNLTTYEIKCFSMLSRSYLAKYGYEIPDMGITMADLLRILKDLLIGIPQRISQVLHTAYMHKRALRLGRSVKGVPVGVMPKAGQINKNKPH